VGVKKFKSVSKIGLPISFVREHYLLSVLKGKHVICAIETFCNHDEPLIVMEWMNFNLDQLVAKKVKYPVKEMFKEIVKSLAELHEN
jgi:serine/threonine protein kinase